MPRCSQKYARNSVETRALCLQNREKRRRFSDKHTDPSIRPYASKRMTRPVNLTSKPVYIPFTIADLVTRDRLFVHRQRYMRGISFYYRIRGKECLDRSRTIWYWYIYIKIINFLKRYSTLRVKKIHKYNFNILTHQLQQNLLTIVIKKIKYTWKISLYLT